MQQYFSPGSNTTLQAMILQTELLVDALCKATQNQEILPWLSNYTEFGSFRYSSSPEGSIRINQIGQWLFLTVTISYVGTTMDQTTDRLSGDPYKAYIVYDWIGLLKDAPTDTLTKENLDEWAVFNAQYVCEWTDIGNWGVHEGSWVEKLTEDGTVIIREACGKFKDEPPTFKAITRTVKLNSP